MWIHRINAMIILGITLAYGIMAIQNSVIDNPPGGHTIFGTIVVYSIGGLVLYGVFIRIMMNRLSWKTRYLIALKTIH